MDEILSPMMWKAQAVGGEFVLTDELLYCLSSERLGDELLQMSVPKKNADRRSCP